MKKRVLLLLAALLIVVAQAFAGVNRTLNQARDLYRTATTVMQYQNAKKKFESARTDPGYVRMEHESAIVDGIRNCDRRISELSGHLTVGGSSTSTSISFSANGGTKTLSVSCNGRPTVNGVPSWLTRVDVSESSLTVQCPANSSLSARSGRFTVNSGGRSVTVNVSQAALERTREEFTITRMTFANTDADGDILTPYGQKLNSSEMRYLKPKIYYDWNGSSTTRRLYVKLFQPNGQLDTGDGSPDGYTYSCEVEIDNGSNAITLSGWGNRNQSNFPAGTYTAEIWHDGKRLYSGTVDITGNPLSIKDITFGNAQSGGTMINEFGSTLVCGEMRYLKPRITYSYTGPTSKKFTFLVKLFNPDGTMRSASTSPEGYTYTLSDVTIEPGRDNNVIVSGWGHASQSVYIPGRYTYELWYDGECLYSANVNISGSELTVTNVEFGNCDYDNNMLTPFGQPLISKDMRYLRPRFTYNWTGANGIQRTLKCKVYNPDGELRTGSSSPEGYTFERTINLQNGENQVYVGTGWGNRDRSIYPAGTYRFEVWDDGKMIYQTSFVIGGDLLVDGKKRCYESFGCEGGYHTFNVSGASDWSIWGLPSFCKIVSRNDNSFQLYCEPNSGAERHDYLKVQTSQGDVRIDIFQTAGGNNPSAVILETWTEATDDQEGMRVHTNLTVEHFGVGSTCTVELRFYFDDNSTVLHDPDNNPLVRSSSGNINYDPGDFKDFTIYVPYSWLNMAPGDWALSYDIIVRDQSGHQVARRNDNKFSFVQK